MKNTRTMALVVLALLALSGVWFLPTVTGQGRENSLVRRVEILEELVVDLCERVEYLQGGSCTCDVLNLQLLADLPSNPSEGDLCVVWSEYQPGEYGNTLYCYLDGDWRMAARRRVPNPNPRQ
jgi:hypothetical protein